MKTTVLSLGILLFGAGSCGKWRKQSFKKPATGLQADARNVNPEKNDKIMNRLPLNFN